MTCTISPSGTVSGSFAVAASSTPSSNNSTGAYTITVTDTVTQPFPPTKPFASTTFVVLTQPTIVPIPASGPAVLLLTITTPGPRVFQPNFDAGTCTIPTLSFDRRIENRKGSTCADLYHAISDFFSTSLVFVALALVSFGYLIGDTAISLALAAMLGDPEHSTEECVDRSARRSVSLLVGGTYTIQLIGGTATQGYNQLEDFINFPNSIFQSKFSRQHDILGGQLCLRAQSQQQLLCKRLPLGKRP